MNDEVAKYKLVACKNCRTVNAMFFEDVRKEGYRTLDCRVCGKNMEYMVLEDAVFEGSNIEKDIMGQFL